ncbi:MAG: FAD-dependent oxidoreductase [Parachlamydiales bacterium]|nr:FAD-dependent oxidoreductase [Parachlamydiales bacterium]
MQQADVIIIGAGVAGLSCAKHLQQKGISHLILESQPEVGGRLQTDLEAGYLLDRGFQIYFTSYEEPCQLIDIRKLGLKPFDIGSYIYKNGKIYSIAKFFSGYPNLLQKIKLWRYIRGLKKNTCSISEGHLPFKEVLKRTFSNDLIESFFVPFIGGITLDKSLSTSTYIVDEILRSLMSGQSVLPKEGMGMIAKEIAKGLNIYLNTKVSAVQGQTVILKSGEKLTAKAVVIATDAKNGSDLIMDFPRPKAFKAVTTFYFTAAKSPFKKPLLLLNAQKLKLVNHLAVLSDVQPSYSTTGRALISVTLIGDHPEDVLSKVKNELRELLGVQTDEWQFLKYYCVKEAHPVYDKKVPARLGNNRYLAGDFCYYASIDKAALAGREAAEAIHEDLLN